MHERTGLVAFWKNYDRKLHVKAAQLADELGYDSFWLPEAWGYEVFPLLTEMALATKRIKLGTGIVNVFSRSPALLAQSAATVDEISEGRLILGLGTSGKRVIEGFHGRPFDRPLTQLGDVIRVVKTLIAGKSLDGCGAELTRYRPFQLAMKPVRPDIPIYVAALRQKSITAIGEMADGWIPTFWPYEGLQRGIDWIAEGARRAGRDPAEITVAPYTTVIPLGNMAAQKAKELIAFYVAGMGDYYRELLESFGYRDECARIADLYRSKATRAQATEQVTDAMMEALCVTGSPAECVAELRRRRSFGIGLPIINLPPDAPGPLVEMFIRGMAPQTA